MHIKVYFNDKPLFLANAIDKDIEPYAHHDDAVLVDEFSSPGINSMIHEMKQEKVHAGILLHTNLEQLRKAFWKKFEVIRAAGGIVRNPDNHILLIFRRGKWDLPKGKMDPGETIEDCAIRETEEETGLKKVQAHKRILITYHTYDENGKHILKETYWYDLSVSDHQELVPQTEEQITDIKWVEPADLKSYMDNSYPLVIDLLKTAGYNW